MLCNCSLTIPTGAIPTRLMQSVFDSRSRISFAQSVLGISCKAKENCKEMRGWIFRAKFKKNSKAPTWLGWRRKVKRIGRHLFLTVTGSQWWFGPRPVVQRSGSMDSLLLVSLSVCGGSCWLLQQLVSASSLWSVTLTEVTDSFCAVLLHQENY